MPELRFDLLIVGGGTGGVAAALGACALGLNVVLTEETDWVGGQLTSQIVPPDEHPWIEQYGCTKRYRSFRDGVRAWYQMNRPGLTGDAALNPGGGWVSRLCFEPKVGLQVLQQMLQPLIQSGRLTLMLRTVAVTAEADGDRVGVVLVSNLDSGDRTSIAADYFIDATESGELLPMAGVETVTGSESKWVTDEAHGSDTARPANMQALTWCFAMAHDPGSNRTIDRPDSYDRWRVFQPSFWPGPLLGEADLDPQTGARRTLPFVEGDPTWFGYRQIRSSAGGEHPITVVNWPMNDYFVKPVIDVPPAEAQKRLEDAKQLGYCLLYWLQTERGYTGLYLRPDITDTADGFAKAPYLRESRRIQSMFTVMEQHVSVADNPERKFARTFRDSVGIGSYRIDLHPSTDGDSYIDLASLPFQIPLGALVPKRVENLLPGCKNIGTTHVTNGCYRMHPVEWNIGEAAGLLVGFCIGEGVSPHQVLERTDLVLDYQTILQREGIDLEWPENSA